MEVSNYEIPKRQNVFTKRKAIEIIEPYLFLFPGLLLFTLFVFYPFIKTIYLSLNNTDSMGNAKIFVGIQNYIDLFTSPTFQNSLVVTAKFAAMVIIPTITIAFILAVFSNAKIGGIGFFRTTYALPLAISSASAAIIWNLILHPSIGMLNYFLQTDIGWLTSPKWGLLAVAVVTMWMSTGLNYIFLIAGLQGIPQELYESASIDGAGGIKKHWYITLPSLSPILFFLLIIDAINTFQVFGQINLMTRGGPGEATNVLVYSIYRDAFVNNRFGLASAESIILFVILLVLTTVQFKFGEKKVTYG